MAGLPKIALVRLKAKPEAPKTSGASARVDLWQGAEHPDANLLAAFVEKNLTERERTQVLNHLTQCAECREVAAFTMPAEAAVAEPTLMAAGRRWNPWPVLRWGGLAAALGVLTIVVVLHPDLRNGHPELAKETHPAVPPGSITGAPQTVPAATSAQPAPEPAEAKAQSAVRESAGEMAALKKESASHGGLTQDEKDARAKAKQQVTYMASVRPPATLKAENVPSPNAEEKVSRGANAVAAEVYPAPAPPAAPAAATMAASDAAAKASAEPQAGGETLRATAQSAGVARGIGGVSPMQAPKLAPRAPAEGSMRMTPQVSMVAIQGSRKDNEAGAGLPSALWSVSPDGKVQRSADGGKSMEQARVAPGIKFRAIAAIGNDVWAGGSHGALFHSPDGGASWTRVALMIEGNTIKENITAILLHDPQHLTVIMASGAQWVSDDGGQRWQKEP